MPGTVLDSTGKIQVALDRTLPDHDHSGDAGDGGQLDWDLALSDAVHNHSTNAEGGKLDWDLVWSDAVHDHSSSAEGGAYLYPIVVDLNGVGALILDADGDTTISAPTDDQVDFEVAGSDEAHLTIYGLSAQNHAFRAKNTSGGTATVGDVGYIDAAGEYKTTTTAYYDAEWCVVVKGGSNNADIYVTRRGRVSITLNGDCSVGDYLYTSTTAGQAQPQSYERPELLAVALTANAAGAGSTCEALLLCHTKPVALSPAEAVYRVSTSTRASDLDWNGTIDSLPGGAAVRYDTASGDEANLIPYTGAGNYAKLRLYNVTQDEYALISDSDPTGGAGYDGEITLTENVPGTWGATDSITIRSQTNTTTVGASYFADVEIENTSFIPALTRILEMEWSIRDTGGASEQMRLHPWETNDNNKRRASVTQVANITIITHGVKVPLIQRRFCVLWSGSAANTVSFELGPRVAWVASP